MGRFDRWPKQQPVQPGELVVGCSHTSQQPLARAMPDPRNEWQWFEVMPPVVMPDPHGSDLSSRWIVTCAACYRSAKGDVRAITIRQHWRMPSSTDDHVAALRELGDNRPAILRYLEGLEGQQLLDVAEAISLA